MENNLKDLRKSWWVVVDFCQFSNYSAPHYLLSPWSQVFRRKPVHKLCGQIIHGLG